MLRVQRVLGIWYHGTSYYQHGTTRIIALVPWYILYNCISTVNVRQMLVIVPV